MLGYTSIRSGKNRTNKMFYNTVTTELQSFTPGKAYNALKYMLNPFVHLKVKQRLNTNYFETLDFFLHFSKKLIYYNVQTFIV